MSNPNGRRPLYVLDARQAEKVRRIVSEKGWAAAARALGWPVANARQNVRNALRRAPAPPPPTPKEAAREAAVRRAEEDPVLARRCAGCGRPGYDLVRCQAARYEAEAVPMALLGGRWLCPKCAPRRRMAPDVCHAFAVPYGPAK